MMEIYLIQDNDIEKVEFEAMVQNSASKYWIIATPEEISSKNEFFKINDSIIKECFDSKQHTRLEVYNDMIFGTISEIDKESSHFVAKEINFYLTKDRFILISKVKNKLIDRLHKEIIENGKDTTNYHINFSKILYLLLDGLTAMDGAILKKIEGNIAALEEQVMAGTPKDFTQDIITLRKRLFFLKRYYEPLLSMVEDLEENENGFIEENALKYFRILNNRVARLNNGVLNLRDYVTQVREAYQAQVDINLNKTMKLFTVITAVFFPLTLIAGWYGMNFKFMPELSWQYGYPFVFVLSGIVVTISLGYFKRHHYI